MSAETRGAAFSRAVGVLPVEYKGNNQGRFIISRFGITCCVCGVIIISAAASIIPSITEEIISEQKQLVSSGGRWSLVVIVISTFLLAACSLISAFIFKSHTVDIFNQVSLLKRHLLQLTSFDETTWSQLLPLLLYQGLRILGELFSAYCIFYYTFNKDKLIYLLIIQVINLPQLSIDLQIWSLCLFLERAFHSINCFMEELCELKVKSKLKLLDTVGVKSKHPNIKWRRNDMRYSLATLRKLHGELCDLSTLINKRFGLDLMMAIVVGRMLMIFFLYVMVSAFLGNRVKSSVSITYQAHLAVIVAVNFSRVFGLCSRFTAISNKAASVISILQHSNFENMDRSTVEEIKVFTMQLQCRSLKFTVLGFFDLDMGLISSIVGSVITYIVILIQFETT